MEIKLWSLILCHKVAVDLELQDVDDSKEHFVSNQRCQVESKYLKEANASIVDNDWSSICVLGCELSIVLNNNCESSI